MKKIVVVFTLLLTFVFLAQKVNAQSFEEEVPLNKQFYVEVGGPGSLFSAHFDGRFNSGERLGFGYRLGLGYTNENLYNDDYYDDDYYYDDDHFNTILTIPVGVNYVFGKSTSPHTFEVGAGITIFSKKIALIGNYREDAGYFAGSFEFMYRRQPINTGFTWRTGFTPYLTPGGEIVPGFVIGFGYSF